jgi:hypothetical protein
VYNLKNEIKGGNRMSKCGTCLFANRSGNPEFVFCTKFARLAGEKDMEPEEFIKKYVFPETSINLIALGWGYPNQGFRSESNWIIKGTATEGLMWANQICIGKDETCNEYEDNAKIKWKKNQLKKVFID